jgi:magnesium chelatase subunit H
MKRIVAIAGFESFNANLYRQTAEMAMGRCEGLEAIFFSDRNLNRN